MKDSCIGFIGLGNVGEKVANNILQSKYNLFIFDKDIKKGKKLIVGINSNQWLVRKKGFTIYPQLTSIENSFLIISITSTSSFFPRFF